MRDALTFKLMLVSVHDFHQRQEAWYYNVVLVASMNW